MSQTLKTSIAVISIDIGKNSFSPGGPRSARCHRVAAEVVARPGRSPARQSTAVLDRHEARVGAHHLSRKLHKLGHDARLMPAKYVRPYSKGQKNDFRVPRPSPRRCNVRP